MKLVLHIILTVMTCCLACPASETNVAKVIMKSGIEKLNKVDVWIEVLDAKEQGVVVDLHIAAQLGLEAGKVDVAAASSDENPIPLKFLTYGTINTSNVTFIDYLASRGAMGNLSSVTITWRGQVKKFPLFEVNK